MAFTWLEFYDHHRIIFTSFILRKKARRLHKKRRLTVKIRHRIIWLWQMLHNRMCEVLWNIVFCLKCQNDKEFWSLNCHSSQALHWNTILDILKQLSLSKNRWRGSSFFKSTANDFTQITLHKIFPRDFAIRFREAISQKSSWRLLLLIAFNTFLTINKLIRIFSLRR